MAEYNPDRWVILNVTNPTTNKYYYKVFAGCYGGYGGSDSWQLNSGIANVEIDGDYFNFHGESGSVYRCHKKCEGMSSYMMSVLNSWNALGEDKVKLEVIPMDEYQKI